MYGFTFPMRAFVSVCGRYDGRGVASEQFHCGTFIAFIHATIFEILSHGFQLTQWRSLHSICHSTKSDALIVNRHHHWIHIYKYQYIFLSCSQFAPAMKRWSHKKDKFNSTAHRNRTTHTHCTMHGADRCSEQYCPSVRIEDTPKHNCVIVFDERRLNSVQSNKSGCSVCRLASEKRIEETEWVREREEESINAHRTWI